MYNLNKVQKMLVLYHYCSENYDSMWSQAYLYMCMAGRYLRKFGIDRPLDIPLRGNEKKFFTYLEKKFNNKKWK